MPCLCQLFCGNLFCDEVLLWFIVPVSRVLRFLGPPNLQTAPPPPKKKSCAPAHLAVGQLLQYDCSQELKQPFAANNLQIRPAAKASIKWIYRKRARANHASESLHMPGEREKNSIVLNERYFEGR